MILLSDALIKIQLQLCLERLLKLSALALSLFL